MMDFTVRVLCVAFIYSVNTSAMCGTRTELIKNITLSLTAYFQTTCLVFFHGFRNSSKNFDVFKAMSSDHKRFAGVYTFEDRRSRKSCSKPMNVLIGDELKAEFSTFTNRDSMTDEVWLVFLTSPPFDFINLTRPSFDSEVIVAEIQNDQKVFFWEVYSVDVGFPLRIVDFGNWTEEDGLNLPRNPLYDRRSDLEGKVLRIGSNENWPVCSFSNGIWDGYMPRIWQEVEGLINCTTVPVRSVDNATGLQFENGSWNGLMGMLLKSDIDVIAAELTLTNDRINVIKFGYPAMSSRYQIYFRALGYRLEWQAIFKPLSLSTWLALLSWTIIGSMSIFVSYACSIRCGFEEDEKIKFTRTESFFFILQSLCQQGYPVVPKSLSCRILFVTAYALSTIMIPSYSASLISSLTYQSPIRPFDSLEGMANDGQYRLLVKKNSASFSQFSKATDPLYKKAYRTLVDPVNLHKNIHMDDAVSVLDEIVCEEKNYAFYGIDIITSLKMEHRSPQCHILKLSQPLSPVFVAMGLRKNSPFSRIIDQKLQKLINIGAISRLQSNLRPLGRESSSELAFRQVEVDEIFQVFLLLLLGMVLSVFILIIEMVMWKFNGRLPKNVVRMKDGRSNNKRSAYVLCFDFYMD